MENIKKIKKNKKWWSKKAKWGEQGKGTVDSRHQQFYCTVCKMKTWTFHEHEGRNTSSTKSKIRLESDISRIE